MAMLKVIAIATILNFTLIQQVFPQSRAPDELCDQLAGHPWEPGRNGRGGVEWNEVDAASAIPACRAALAQHPDAPEVKYRLARTLMQVGAYDEALPMMLEAAEAGYSPAETAYGTAFMQGQGVYVDYAVALEWLRRGAGHNHPIAQHNLALMLMNGQGTPVEPIESFRLSSAASEAGYALAMDMLGYMYELGIGVTRDYAQSYRWYGKAGSMGINKSSYAVARALELGRGTPQDPQVAINWWRDLAPTEAYSTLRVGAAYEDGNGVPRDPQQALTWYGYAAAGGTYGPAMLALGALSLKEAKTPEQVAVALQWLHRAALSDQNEAYLILAEHYEAEGDFRSAMEMAQLAAYYSHGPIARLAKEIVERVGSKAAWPTTPGRLAAGSDLPTENSPGGQQGHTIPLARAR